MSDQNGNSENKNSQRLNQMEDVIQSMITLVLEQSKLSTQQHQHAMEELHELRELQREQRIDIMALFHGNETLRKMMQQYFERNP